VEHDLPPIVAGPPPEDARSGLVLVHGRDQGPEFMLDVVERLALRDTAIVMPRATGSSWYPGRYFDPVEANEPSLTRALAACEATLDNLRLPPGRIVLMGFSQGACVVAELVARAPRPLAGVAVLTGALMGERGTTRVTTRSPATPMLFASSIHDEWVSADDVRDAAAAFEAAGARVTLELSEEREHQVSDLEIERLRGMVETWRDRSAGTTT
jgi:phospholipase/carboxylesterase